MLPGHNSAGMVGHVCRIPRHEPPILHGILNRRLWVANRINDILEAIEDYRRHNYTIPVEWIEELLDHMKETKK